MGLKALRESKEIISISIEENKWQELKKDRQYKNTLTMPCCSAKVIMKNSHLGLQYFAHSKRGNCNSKPESIEHIASKTIAYHAAIKSRWNPKIEHILYLPNNERIIADILLEKNGRRIALEFQFSNQTIHTMLDRTNKYKQLNIPVVWFNGFTNKSYNYSNNIFNSNFQMYQISINKTDKILDIFCENELLKNFISNKLQQTELLNKNFDIQNCIEVDEDSCIRINRNKILDDGSIITLEQTWLGYSNGFYIEAQNDEVSHLFKGKYIQGFKVSSFEILINYESIIT